jgi:hypothetical protein
MREPNADRGLRNRARRNTEESNAGWEVRNTIRDTAVNDGLRGRKFNQYATEASIRKDR